MKKDISNDDVLKHVPSAGSVGGRIRALRVMRGLTQKELGVRCGFSLSTAEVRIAQYETEKKLPRKQALEQISEALDVNIDALYEGDLVPHNRLFHVLFDMEAYHGLHPVIIDGRYCLEFDGVSIFGLETQKEVYEAFLDYWYHMRKSYLKNISSDDEMTPDQKKSYMLKKAEYTASASNLLSFSKAIHNTHRILENDDTYVEDAEDFEHTRADDNGEIDIESLIRQQKEILAQLERGRKK